MDGGGGGGGGGVCVCVGGDGGGGGGGTSLFSENIVTTLLDFPLKTKRQRGYSIDNIFLCV